MAYLEVFEMFDGNILHLLVSVMRTDALSKPLHVIRLGIIHCTLIYVIFIVVITGVLARQK